MGCTVVEQVLSMHSPWVQSIKHTHKKRCLRENQVAEIMGFYFFKNIWAGRVA
jgi:hypothetical protein